MSATLTQFSCEGCGKTYKWKPELSGKKVKCKCGHAMMVPVPPAAAESDDPFADALSEMAEAEERGTTRVAADAAPCPSCSAEMEAGAVMCVQCGYNATTGKQLVRKAEPIGGDMGGGIGLAAAAPEGGAGVLGYQRQAPPSRDARGRAVDNSIGEPFKDLYLPIILFVVGIAVTFFEARFARRIPSIGYCLGYTAFVTVIDLVLVFIGIMIATKMLDLALGPIGPALMKIAAIAVLPGSVATLLSFAIPVMGSFVGWFVSLILIYTMFMTMLHLDFQETMICSTIIWLVRTWAGYAIVMAILSGIGMSLAPIIAPSNVPPPPKPRVVTPATLDAEALKALASPTAMEAKAWIAAGTEDATHVIPLSATFDMGQPQFVQSLYDMGAVKVTVTRFAKVGQSANLEANQLVIQLPADKASRQKLFDWGERLAFYFKFEFFVDKGQKYLLLDYRAAGPVEEVPYNGPSGNNVPEDPGC